MKWMLVALAASSAPQPSCELHVWPAFATGSQAAGWLSNLGIAGALQDYERNKDDRLRSQADLIQALPPQKQAKIIDSLNLQGQPGLGPARIVFEGKFVNARVAKKANERQSASAASCYAELIVSRNIYKSSPLHGRTLSTELIFRDFRNGRPRSLHKTQTAKLAKSDAPLADTEVAAAFRANVSAFIERLHPIPARRSSR